MSVGRRMNKLGLQRLEAGDQAGAIDAFLLAHLGGDRTGSLNLGTLLAKAGRYAEAKVALEAAVRTRDKANRRHAAQQLARVEARLGYQQIVAELGDEVAPWAAVRLGKLLCEQLGDWAEGKKEFEFAAASSHPEAAPVGAYNLGILLEFEEADLPGARAAYQAAATSDHPRVAPVAWLKLGRLHDRMHEPEAAQAAYACAGTDQFPQREFHLGGHGTPPIVSDFYELLDVNLAPR